MEWRTDIDVNSVSGVFGGILQQLEYLKFRVDNVEAKGDDEASQGEARMGEVMSSMGNLKEIILREVSSIYATHTHVTDLETELLSECQELRGILKIRDAQASAQDEKIKLLENNLETTRSEISEMKSLFGSQLEELRTEMGSQFAEVKQQAASTTETMEARFSNVASKFEESDESIRKMTESLSDMGKTVEESVGKVTKLANNVDIFHHQFEHAEERLAYLTKTSQEMRHDVDKTTDNLQGLKAFAEHLDEIKPGMDLLDEKADVLLLNDRAKLDDVDTLRQEMTEHNRHLIMSLSHQKDSIHANDHKLTKRIEFVLNMVRDLQTDANEEDDDAALRCLACNKPVGTMSNETPYKPDRLKTTLETHRRKEEVDDEASPERRRPLPRGRGAPLGVPFAPDGKPGRADKVPNKLKSMYAQPIVEDPLAKETLQMPNARAKRPGSKTMTDTLRMSSANSMRRSETAEGSLEGYMTVGKHLDFVEMSGAIAGYPSLTSGLIPESRELQGHIKGRPTTAPVRRARSVTQNQ